MQIRDLSGKLTSQQLNESLAKNFGYRLQLDQFSDRQLHKVQTKLSEQISEIEQTASFDAVVENHEYQKSRAMLNVVQQEIKERTLTPAEQQKKEKFVTGMKSARGEFKKRYGDRGEEVMHRTATKMAKKENVDEAMDILRSALTERTLNEGEEEKAALIMSSRDMVDKITGWLEDVGSMKTETMLDLVDSIRDELGNEISQQFTDTVKPALEELYLSLEQHRTTLAQAVSILTGEEGPQGIGAPPGTKLGASKLVAPELPEIPPEPESRLKRESIEYSRKLGTMLSSTSKKK